MTRLSAIFIACLALFGGTAAAQETTPTEGQKSVEQLKAETELLNAQTAKMTAEQNAEKARNQVEIDRLNAEKGLREAKTATEKSARQDELDKLKAQKELIAAATPAITGLPQGDVTFEKDGVVSVESTVKAYEAVQQAAVTIGQGIKTASTSGSVFVILGANDVAAITGLSVFEAQAALITKRLTDLDALQKNPGLAVPTRSAAGGPSSALSAIGLIGPAINAAAGLIGLFRVDDTFVVKDETPSLRAVYGAVAAQLKGHGAVYFPEIMPAHLLQPVSPVQTTLNVLVDALDKLRTTYFARLAQKAATTSDAAKLEEDIKKATKLLSEIEALQKEIAALGQSPADLKKKKALEAQVAEKRKALPVGIGDATTLSDQAKFLGALRAFLDANDKYVAIIEAVLKAGDDYIGAMAKADAAATAPLQSLIAAERVRRIYREKPETTYAIELTVEKLSGTRKQHRNFFGTSISFSGGAVTSYRMFQASSGQLVASATVSIVQPFTKVKEQ